MSEPLRSADLQVKTALAAPRILNDLKAKPEETLKELGKDAVRQLPQPGGANNDAISLIVVAAFVLVMIGSAYVLGSGVTSELKRGADYVTKSETVLTIFTTLVAFLAGLLSPSPLKRQ